MFVGRFFSQTRKGDWSVRVSSHACFMGTGESLNHTRRFLHVNGLRVE